MHGLPTHEVANLEDWFAHSFPVRTGTSRGLAVVYPWVDGLILNDPFAHGSLPHQHRGSALNQFRTLPVEHVLGVCDGCLMYDFERSVVHLVDLDLYRPGPYVLEADRQYGSRRFMAPEELCRGATIDERTTAFTVGRMARVLLGEEGA